MGFTNSKQQNKNMKGGERSEECETYVNNCSWIKKTEDGVYYVSRKYIKYFPILWYADRMHDFTEGTRSEPIDNITVERSLKKTFNLNNFCIRSHNFYDCSYFDKDAKKIKEKLKNLMGTNKIKFQTGDKQTKFKIFFNETSKNNTREIISTNVFSFFDCDRCFITDNYVIDATGASFTDDIIANNFTKSHKKWIMSEFIDGANNRGRKSKNPSADPKSFKEKNKEFQIERSDNYIYVIPFTKVRDTFIICVFDYRTEDKFPDIYFILKTEGKEDTEYGELVTDLIEFTETQMFRFISVSEICNFINDYKKSRLTIIGLIRRILCNKKINYMEIRERHKPLYELIMTIVNKIYVELKKIYGKFDKEELDNLFMNICFSIKTTGDMSRIFDAVALGGDLYSNDILLCFIAKIMNACNVHRMYSTGRGQSYENHLNSSFKTNDFDIKQERIEDEINKRIEDNIDEINTNINERQISERYTDEQTTDFVQEQDRVSQATGDIRNYFNPINKEEVIQQQDTNIVDQEYEQARENFRRQIEEEQIELEPVIDLSQDSASSVEGSFDMADYESDEDDKEEENEKIKEAIEGFLDLEKAEYIKDEILKICDNKLKELQQSIVDYNSNTLSIAIKEGTFYRIIEWFYSIEFLTYCILYRACLFQICYNIKLSVSSNPEEKKNKYLFSYNNFKKQSDITFELDMLENLELEDIYKELENLDYKKISERASDEFYIEDYITIVSDNFNNPLRSYIKSFYNSNLFGFSNSSFNEIVQNKYYSLLTVLSDNNPNTIISITYATQRLEQIISLIKEPRNIESDTSGLVGGSRTSLRETSTALLTLENEFYKHILTYYELMRYDYNVKTKNIEGIEKFNNLDDFLEILKNISYFSFEYKNLTDDIEGLYNKIFDNSYEHVKEYEKIIIELYKNLYDKSKKHEEILPLYSDIGAGAAAGIRTLSDEPKRPMYGFSSKKVGSILGAAEGTPEPEDDDPMVGEGVAVGIPEPEDDRLLKLKHRNPKQETKKTRRVSRDIRKDRTLRLRKTRRARDLQERRKRQRSVKLGGKRKNKKQTIKRRRKKRTIKKKNKKRSSKK